MLFLMPEITLPSLSIFACLTRLSGPCLVVTFSRKRAFTAQISGLDV